jgi:hypothetical protein
MHAWATTPVFIENRMKIEIHRAKRIARDIKPERLRAVRKHYWFKADQLDKLMENDFAGRAIYEANRDRKARARNFILIYMQVVCGKIFNV